MNQIVEITTGKTDKNGNAMKICKFSQGQAVFVNQKYNKELYDQVIEGAEYDLVQDGEYWKIDDGTGAAPPVESKKAKEVHVAQDRKSESIAWFNATNSAIAMLKLDRSGEALTAEKQQEALRYWRKWFLAEWKDQPPF